MRSSRKTVQSFQSPIARGRDVTTCRTARPELSAKRSAEKSPEGYR